jgi:elongation factor G
VKSYSTSKIRNVALLGHCGSGKTTVAEALLARAGAIARAGRVDDGTSTLDTEPEEFAHHISLSMALAPFEWRTPDGTDHKINLIDCPGYPDFIGEVHAAMAVVDLAVFVVSAVDGVQVQTELMWREAVRLGMPRLVFVNKDDKDRADFHGVLDQLSASFGQGFAPLELPLGEAGALHGVADVLSEEAFDYEPGGGHHVTSMPVDVAVEEHQLHEAVVEEIVAGDDERLERYLSGEVLTVAELETTLASALLNCRVFPVLVGSALTGVGIDRLADFICELGPSPLARPTPVIAGTETVPVMPDADGQSLIHVFKTIADPFVGQLSVFKVLSGTIKTDDRLVNSRDGTDERLHGLFVLRGKEQTAVAAVVAGDLAAVAKLTATRTGDALGPKNTPVRVANVPTVTPHYGVAIVPHTQTDDDKLATALQRLQSEDPVMRVDRVEETNQTVLRGMGDLHVAVTLERLARKFGVHVDVVDVRMPYRETALSHATAEGKVKKQSGGHGQFAVASLRVEPLPRGAGFQFTDGVVGGAIPRNYIPAVQRGVEETMVAGGVHGFPVVDVHVEVLDGKFHSVDSSEMAFKTAASLAFKQALLSAGVSVLEPVSLVHVTVPSALQGDVMSDILSRRGRVQGTTATLDGSHEIIALVPTSELARYAVELRSMTGGRGEFTVQHDRYDTLPTHLVERAKQSLPKR